MLLQLFSVVVIANSACTLVAAPALQPALHHFKRQATDLNSTSVVVSAYNSVLSSASVTHTAFGTLVSGTVVSGIATRTFTSAFAPATTATGCNTLATGNSFTDGSNVLVCQLNTLAAAFSRHSECIPKGSGHSCDQVLQANIPCSSATTEEAAARCVCTTAYYEGWKLCTVCTGNADTNPLFVSACQTLGYRVDVSVTSPTASGTTPLPSTSMTGSGSQIKVVGSRLLCVFITVSFLALNI